MSRQAQAWKILEEAAEQAGANQEELPKLRGQLEHFFDFTQTEISFPKVAEWSTSPPALTESYALKLTKDLREFTQHRAQARYSTAVGDVSDGDNCDDCLFSVDICLDFYDRITADCYATGQDPGFCVSLGRDILNHCIDQLGMCLSTCAI